MRKNEENQKNLIPRPPIVVVMGHIDHGKTTLLDAIRESNVAEKEAGGITQHIGAYEIITKSEKPEYHNRRLTFLDTPGHEAFLAIRARGAQIGDVAILVVAADEGVKPQTLEALEHIKKANLPFVVAINKIDRPEANPEKVKKQLAEAGVLLEGWGGDVPCVLISAKEKKNLDQLLELVLLLADLKELKADPSSPAKGVVVESKLDRRRGIVATLIIKDGTLTVGQEISTPTATGKIKIMEDFLGRKIKTATFSSPVLVVGFKEMPLVGEEFWVGKKEELKKEEKKPKISLEEKPSKEVNYLKVIIKADVFGSLEALKILLEKISLPENWQLKIVEASLGDIFVNDIQLAQTAQAIILGFRVNLPKELKELAIATGVKIYLFEVIYELEKFLKEEIEKLISSEKEVQGEIEVLACFSQRKTKQVIGGRVIQGKIVKGNRVKIIRQEEEIGQGKILNLQSEKQDVREIRAVKEAGILIDSEIEIKIGDKLLVI